MHNFDMIKMLSESCYYLYAATDVSEIQNVNIYTYRELRIATEGFSSANKIGQGGFGVVYKVIAVVVWYYLDLRRIGIPIKAIFVILYKLLHKHLLEKKIRR